MLNENAKKWIAALRSGEYKQGRQKLLTPEGGFCCLGVACDLYRKETGEGQWRVDGLSGNNIFVVNGEYSVYWTPETIKEWLGLKTERGMFYDDAGEEQNLTILNDGAGLSLEEIAKVIESEPEGLFA